MFSASKYIFKLFFKILLHLNILVIHNKFADVSVFFAEFPWRIPSLWQIKKFAVIFEKLFIHM